jgi:hypothetical protein
MSKSWTTTVVANPEDPNEVLLPLPDDLVTSLGWDENTELEWEIDLNTKIISIRKI